MWLAGPTYDEALFYFARFFTKATWSEFLTLLAVRLGIL